MYEAAMAFKLLVSWPLVDAAVSLSLGFGIGLASCLYYWLFFIYPFFDSSSFVNFFEPRRGVL